MIAIQDQIIETKYYRKHIIKNLPNDTCRKCNSAPGTIQHITGACKSIAQIDYKHRHDQVANVIHQKLAHQYKLIVTVTRLPAMPKPCHAVPCRLGSAKATASAKATVMTTKYATAATAQYVTSTCQRGDPLLSSKWGVKI